MIDENGCVLGYCCTGIDVTLDNAGVVSRLEISMHGSARVENIGDYSISFASIKCEVRSPDDDSLIAECDEYTLVSEEMLHVGDSLDVELDSACTLTGSEPCEQDVVLNCTYRWETIGCYSNGERTTSATTIFHCFG